RARHARALVLEDLDLRRAPPGSSVLDRPAGRPPAPGRQLFLPERVVLAAEQRVAPLDPRPQLGGQLGLDECADFAPEPGEVLVQERLPDRAPGRGLTIGHIAAGRGRWRAPGPAVRAARGR